MTDVLIRTSQQWEDYVSLKVKNKVKDDDRFFVDHDLFAEFSVWALKRAIVKGVVVGVVGTLFFVVTLGIIVRLLM